MSNAVEPLEIRRLMSSVLTLSPSTGNNTWYLREDANLLNIDIWHNSAVPGSGSFNQSAVISSTSSIVVNGNTGTTVLVQGGNIPVPVTFNNGTGASTLNISAGTFTIASNTSASNLTINDNGSLFFTAGALGSGISVDRLAALNVLASGSVTVDTPESAGDRSVLMLNSLSVASTGLLDLTGNDMIVHNGDASTLTSLIIQGYNNAGVTWKGAAGITSSLAARNSTHLSALGILQNSTDTSALYSTFDGQTAVSTDVLVKYTFMGDANLSGNIDGTDYSRVDSAFVSHATGWTNGDFNYDGNLNGTDYTLLDNAFNAQPAAASPLIYQLNNSLNVAQEQAQKTVANLANTGEYPQYVNADGSLSLVANNHWTSGTWPGLLWSLYQATGNVYYANEAAAFTTPLTGNQTQTSDIGFRIYDAFDPDIVQNPANAARDVAVMVNASNSKLTTYNATVGAFEAWRSSTSGNPAANYNVLMDLIMDSPLLFWAAKQTGNQTYYNDAVSNAVIEETYLVHSDGTSSQFAYFNSANGAFVDNEAYQGYSNTSTWARGEAWAIYGFAQVYSATGRSDFLATSEKAANWFISHLPSDNVPYWDFSDPAIPNTYRDTSAAAIAASGLLQLSQLIKTSDPTNSAKYRTAAASILQSLASKTYLANPATTDNGVLLQGALNVPANPSIYDNSIDFGDYYFVQAINLYVGT